MSVDTATKIRMALELENLNDMEIGGFVEEIRHESMTVVGRG
jgi:hypothetical protein